MKETWRPVKGYEGHYEVSNLGNVRSIKFGKTLILKASYTRGYKQVYLYLNGKSKHSPIHRMVAESFIDNPLNKEQVNHKNGIKDDNRLENLEWVTRSENTKHAIKMGLLTPPENKTPKSSKKILQVDFHTGKVIQEFPSITSAAGKTGVDRMNIKNVCRGCRKTAGGFIWKYK